MAPCLLAVLLMHTQISRIATAEDYCCCADAMQSFEPEDVPVSMVRRLSQLTDAELQSLEDDLDFFAFTGLKSNRITELLALLSDSDVWARQKI